MEQGHLAVDLVKAMKDDKKITQQLKYKLNPDLQEEREKCSFNSEDFAIWYFGGKEQLQKTRDYENYFIDLIDSDSETPEYYLSHKEIYNECIKKVSQLFKKRTEDYGGLGNDYEEFHQMFSGRLEFLIAPEGNPFLLHISMFLNAVFNQADDDQIAEYAPRIAMCQIVGTYAQTELGHGTFMQGLETTATYDEATQEFVLHTPSLSAYKWWPGALGHTANYAIVVAQLYTQGKCHGVHPFLVQLRDEDTHKPLPGIIIGEIGAKMGWNSANNGFLGFDHFRISRRQMLMKNAKVLEDGTYIKPKSRKLNYAAMLYMRTMILNQVTNILCKATIIAIRYSCVRRQGMISPDEPEVKIIEYVSQQYKLFTSLAKVIVFKSVSSYFYQLYIEVNDQMREGNIENLADIHATICCLKAVITREVLESTELCRFACGGHGYMMSSRLPQLYATAAAACTYEGENTVLLLQTARYLVKAWTAYQTEGHKLSETLKFIEVGLSRSDHTIPWTLNFDGYQKGLEAVAFDSLKIAVNKINTLKSRGHTPEESNNLSALELVNAATDYCHYYLIKTTLKIMQDDTISVPKEIRETLFHLIEIYAVDCCLKSMGGLVLTTNIGLEGKLELQKRLEELLAVIRPNAVGIVDGFGFNDRILNSTLGAWDGDVYTRLFEEAMKSPLNQEPVPESFQKYLKPFMQAKY